MRVRVTSPKVWSGCLFSCWTEAVIVPPAPGHFSDRPVSELLVCSAASGTTTADRKSTRLNSSHANISYAVFCLKKKDAVAHIALIRHRLLPSLLFSYLLLRRPPRSTLFPYTTLVRSAGDLAEGLERLSVLLLDGSRDRAAGAGPFQRQAGVRAARLLGRLGHHHRRSEEHTSELQSRQYLVCRLLLEKKRRRSSYCAHTT